MHQKVDPIVAAPTLLDVAKMKADKIMTDQLRNVAHKMVAASVMKAVTSNPGGGGSARAVFPRGEGASVGPVPGGYVQVSRWVTAEEAALWKANGGTYVPHGIGGQSGRVFVTSPGVARPGGTGPVRIDFSVPQAAMQQGGKSGWYFLPQPMQNTPLYNVVIYYP
jgi:hypothetical protein